MSSTFHPTVLVLCTGNSCRSHMAEGFLKSICKDKATIESAGSKPSGYVHPMAIRVMAEKGIDISGHASKCMDQFYDKSIDVVITVCGNAAGVACMQFPSLSKRFHWQFDDPAHFEGTEVEIITEFRRIRDQMATVFVAYGKDIVSGSLEPSFNFISDVNKTIVSDLIASAEIVIFQSPTCPHCREARQVLDSTGKQYTTVDATGDHLNVLQFMTTRSSVPSIWIKGKYVGGNNDGPEPWMGIKKIVAAGKLDEYLQ